MRVLGWVLLAVVWVIWMVTVSSLGSPGGAWSTNEVLVLGASTAALLALGWIVLVQPIRSHRQPPGRAGR